MSRNKTTQSGHCIDIDGRSGRMSIRISPAASLLRNSKLFALPPTIALPAAPPSSDQIFDSDTATTIYPTHAAIQTTSISLSRGDWGFKRPLPSKAFNKTNNPVIRLVQGIDTPEHVADFESAADHALTLRKFQELNHPLRLPDSRASRPTSVDRRDLSVFRSTHDNTTNISSSSAPGGNALNGVWPRLQSETVSKQIPQRLKDEQTAYEAGKKAEDSGPSVDESGARALLESTSHTGPTRPIEVRRWRYRGPSLTQMTGLEFDAYVETLGMKEKEMLKTRIRKEIIRERLGSAREAGKIDRTFQEEDITEEQIADYLRTLRKDPRRFGPMIVEMLDIPEGVSSSDARDESDPWEYGRDTLASEDWTELGPPRTHPSAGLSYVHSTTHANNHPEYGPQRLNPAVLARAVKQKTKAGGSDTTYGLAGFIVPKPDVAPSQRGDRFEPRKGGVKYPLRPGPAWVTETGALRMQAIRPPETYQIIDDKLVFPQEARKLYERQMQERRSDVSSAPSMSDVGVPSQYESSRPQRSRFRQSEDDRRTTPDQDIDGILRQINSMHRKRR